MATQISLAGTDWALKIADVSVVVKDGKVSEKNVRGGCRTISPRTRVSGVTFQVVLPHAIVSDYNTLYALYLAKTAVSVVSTLDIPDGNYIIVDYASALEKQLTEVVYTITMTLSNDIAPKTLAPASDNSLAIADVTLQLGIS